MIMADEGVFVLGVYLQSYGGSGWYNWADSQNFLQDRSIKYKLPQLKVYVKLDIIFHYLQKI